MYIMFLTKIYYLYHYFANYNDIYDNSNTYDLTIINIKNNLKKTTTLTRRYYKGRFIRIKNKIFFRNLKHLYKISPDDLIEAKKNLKKNNNIVY